jgi:hypothetical protein
MFFLAVYSERERERRKLKRQLVTLVSKFGRKPALRCQLYVVTPPMNSLKKKMQDKDSLRAFHFTLLSTHHQR